MLRLTIISLLIVMAVGRVPRVRPNVPKLLDGRIVGGEPATIEELPYQLSLQYLGKHMCGASIISPIRALTAAHCTNNLNASYLSVRAGSTCRNTDGYVVNVDSICQHEGYDAPTVDNDVSVLKLASPLPFSNTIQPISLVNLGQTTSTGALAHVSGWGTTSFEGPNSLHLLKVQLPKVSQDVCRVQYCGYLKVTDNMICFGHPEGGKDSCQGDSGGPLVANGQQIGIVSWGLGCAAPKYPGVYTDISAPSIRNHIEAC